MKVPGVTIVTRIPRRVTSITDRLNKSSANVPLGHHFGHLDDWPIAKGRSLPVAVDLWVISARGLL